jgi:endoglucanase
LDWGVKPGTIYLTKTLQIDPERNTDGVDRGWHWKECVEPWVTLQSKGVGVMVGEWGVYNKTPHDVTLRFMEDALANYQKAGWGWALWNFTGDFGLLDSKRGDVEYEDWEGRKLDRAMLDLLAKY